eukprot:2723810-Amphidinium_carterae.1
MPPTWQTVSKGRLDHEEIQQKELAKENELKEGLGSRPLPNAPSTIFILKTKYSKTSMQSSQEGLENEDKVEQVHAKRIRGEHPTPRRKLGL